MYSYPGTELHLFANAHNWKKYFSKTIKRYVLGDVLDVGAGWGVNAQYLVSSNCTSWTFLEPDQENCAKIDRFASIIKDYTNTLICGKVDTLAPSPQYDTILYIDVLEHIEDDYLELSQARLRLKNNGRLIVLVPCHNSLYSEFDRHIGHYRRYSVEDLFRLESEAFKLKSYFYLDSLGLFCSFLNRFLLKKSLPTHGDIKFWDRFLVPLSCFFDRFFCKSLGKSLVAIYEPVFSEKQL